MPMSFDQSSRASEVVREIERSIRTRGLQAGDRIATKGDLQATFGVARATVNEAIKLLLDRGRITVRPGPKGGLFVATATPELQLGRYLLAVGDEPERVADSVALRDYLDAFVLHEAARHRKPADVQDLREILGELADAASDRGRFVKMGVRFHRRIGLITPNQVLSSTYCGLFDFIETRVSLEPVPEPLDPVAHHLSRVRIHSDIVDVIEQGDLERVNEVLAAHGL